MIPPNRFNSRDRIHSEIDLQTSIIKATNSTDCAPKRKHVRACIVHTWDHRSSRDVWSGLRVLPLVASEVQAFKALILVHKLLQEGHPSVLVDGKDQLTWLESFCRHFSAENQKGYGPLIKKYAEYIIAKLQFHKTHVEFNGIFEYEEYISLKTLNDPNEGYEVISDLLGLQDQLNSLQKLIFSSFRPGSNNECRISSLVPIVVESFGIYKFLTHMLRAFYASFDVNDVLAPLKESYEAQHHRLVKFYYECSNLRYLTNIITVPKLPIDPPNISNTDEPPPTLPMRPAQTGSEIRNANIPPGSSTSSDYNSDVKDTKRIQELQLQQEKALQQQRELEQQREQMESFQRLAQEQLIRDQIQRQAQGRVAELEGELLAAKGQYDRDQMLLQQYDQRVRAMEMEIQQMQFRLNDNNVSQDQALNALREEIQKYKSKYESLAKLYTQLREEHLELLAKHKQQSLKLSTSEEAIGKKERMEKEMKAKNLELAEMIRERDKIRYEIDRTKSNHKEEIDKLVRDLKLKNDTEKNALYKEIEKLTELSSNITESLEEKEKQLSESKSKFERVEGFNNEKNDEIEIQKAELEETLNQLKLIHLEGNKVVNYILDANLEAAIERIDEYIYEFESSMQTGNQNATQEFLLYSLNRGAVSCNDFATSMNEVFADGTNDFGPAIKCLSVFIFTIGEIFSNGKGFTKFLSSDVAKQITMIITDFAKTCQSYFSSLLFHKNLLGRDADAKIDIVINGNVEVQKKIQELCSLADCAIDTKTKKIENAENLDKVVNDSFAMVANTIDNSIDKLSSLMSEHKELEVSLLDRGIHEALFEAANAIMAAIAKLIMYTSQTQAEIVRQGKGELSPSAFYKKNSKWTEGLISAAKSIANATVNLIETSSNVIKGKQSFEYVIVACNKISESTAQLVSASRVRASQNSKSLDKVEETSKEIGKLYRDFVSKVESMLNRNISQDSPEYENMTSHEFKVKEMEQKVAILKYEQELTMARRKLGEMRKFSYKFEED